MAALAPQVVILAGGMATRLRPLTHTVPKALVRVGGRPFLEYQLDWLEAQGVCDVVVLLGHLGDQIVAFLGNGAGRNLRVRYHYDGGQLLGTGGALRGALSVLEPAFVVLNGDTFLDLDLRSFWGTFARGGYQAGLVVGPPNALAGRPNVHARGQSLAVYDATGVDPRCCLWHLGVCAFRADSVRQLRIAHPVDLGHLVDLALQFGPVLAWPCDQSAFDIGTPAGLARFEAQVRHAAMAPGPR